MHLLSVTTRPSRNRSNSLSSIGWRRGLGRGGALVSLDCPSPRSSLHSFVVERGRESAQVAKGSSVTRNICEMFALQVWWLLAWATVHATLILNAASEVP